MLLEVSRLHVRYGAAEAIKGVSLAVEEGSIVSIVGANGAGKTTILRTVSGLKKPASGEIFFQGSRIDGMAPHHIVKSGIAHVPEGRIVFAPMTVLDNLRMGAYLRRDKKETARDLDDIYHHFPILKKRSGQLAGSLSGGEQQMLAVARALMSRPKLLTMDEPSMGLSPKMVREVEKIIRDIHEGGVSVILVEQNARLALRLSDRAYIIETGSITLSGTARELGQDERVRKAYFGG